MILLTVYSGVVGGYWVWGAGEKRFDFVADEPRFDQLFEQLLDGLSERVQLFLFHPEGNNVVASTCDEPEATLARNADRFRIEYRRHIVVVLFECHRVFHSSPTSFRTTLGGYYTREDLRIQPRNRPRRRDRACFRSS